MAENLTNVYDLVNPSPPTLKEISSIAVAENLWRKLNNEDRSSNSPNKLKWRFCFSLNGMLPDLPSTILSTIVRHFKSIHFSLYAGWFKDIFGKFDDIVCDFNGNVDYDKLAKRVVLCEGISNLEKFKIACRYCLEDDIMRIWPSVSEHLNLNDINFQEDPLLYYWICRLRNELHEIPLINYDFASIDEHLIEILNAKNWSSVKYFWNRLKVESRIQNAKYLFKNNPYIFCRYILVRLSKEECDTFVAEADFMTTLLNDRYCLEPCRATNMEETCVLVAWNYVKHKISNQGFIQLIQEILKLQDRGLFHPSFSYKLWNSTPRHLRHLIIQDDTLIRSFFLQNRPRCLLLCILEEIPLKTRRTLWNENWRAVLPKMDAKDLQKLMTSCFRYKSDIILFKKNNLSKYENIRPNCFDFLEQLSFRQLDEFLNCCCLDKQTISTVHVKLLNEYLNFFNRIPAGRCEIRNFVDNTHVLSKFIDDAFNEVDLAANFKNQLLFAPRTIRILSRCVAACIELKKVMEFVDVFSISEQAKVDFKERHFLPGFVNFLTAGFDLDFKFERQGFENFMRWCLGANYKITNFKSTMPINDIVQNIIEDEEAFIFNDIMEDKQKLLRNLYSNVGKFLECCCSTPKQVAKIKKQFVGFKKYTLQ